MATAHTTTTLTLPELKARIETLHKDGIRAFNNRDVDKLVSMYATDALLLPPNHAPASGLKPIREFYREAFDIGLSNFKTELTHIVPTEELIATSGTYTMDVKMKSETIKDVGKFVAVFRLMANGDCKVIFDIWNSDLPPTNWPMK